MNLREIFSQTVSHIREGVNANSITPALLCGFSLSSSWQYAFNGASGIDLAMSAVWIAGIAAAGYASYTIERDRNRHPA